MKAHSQELTVRPHLGTPQELRHIIDVFVLMPFTDDLRPVYDDHIVKVVQNLELSIARADDFFSAQAIINEIWAAICHSQVIIADCTGRNANVFYEIGLAHAVGTPVILITQDRNDVPFDLRHLRYILYNYTPRGIQRFEEQLTETLKTVLGLAESGSNRFTEILFLAANPSDTSRLRFDREMREIHEILVGSRNRERFGLHANLAVRPQDISRALLNYRPRIVHFSGHGSSTGEICVEDESGNTHPISPNALASLFKLVSRTVECVVLNACFSQAQATAIIGFINYVIGIPASISDRSAMAFSTGFYQALTSGSSLSEAYEFGCAQIQLQSPSEAHWPVLLKKSDGKSS